MGGKSLGLGRQAFITPRRAILYHPAYLIRRALYRSVQARASEFEGNILDFGCGSKPYRSLFTAVKTYLGVDLEQSGHDHGTSEIDVFYDGRQLPFEDNTFDAVVSFEVFEHVFNLHDILVELRRVLKPGGQFLFTIPFAWPEHEQPYDFARYTSFGIRSLLEQAGYHVTEIHKSNDSVRAICQLWITFITDQVIPRFGVFARPVKTLMVPIMNLSAVLLSVILPRRDEIYSNLVVRAVRP